MILFALVVLVSVISINDAFAFKTISDDSTGGDCSTMGTWDSATKTCTLTSDLSDGIVITSNGITLDGNGTTISGTYMLTYDPNSAIKGILLDHTTGVTIKNTLVKNFNFGIYLETSDGNTIQSNTLTDNKSGIFLHDSDNNKINLNTITTNPDIARDGLVFINSDGNIFSSNIVSGFIYGIIDEGYSLSNEPIKYGDYFDVKVTITDNTFKNSGGGVALSNVKDSTIQGNTIESNEKGIVIDGKNITIKNNFIKENKGIGLELYFPDNTIKVYNNKFIDNKIQMYIYANEWTKSQVGGNYWNNFDELSEGCKNTSPFDKFCDSPFIFKGGKDEFPLILQNGGIPPPQIDTVSPVEPKPKTDVVVPSTDTDNDGISDPIDQCPTQAETVNGFKDTDGCPDVIPTNTTQLKLPLTFKKTALSWADGKITDYEFLQRVQIEINRGTMVIPEIESDGSGSNEIPSWIKNNAGWWADGTIDDDSFVQGIQYLFKGGMLPVVITLQPESVSTEPEIIPEPEEPKAVPEPTPESNFDLQVIMGSEVYDLSDTATIDFSIDGISTPQNVALEISDPRGTSIISRSFEVDSQGVPFEFRIDENFKTGTYKVVATSSDNGNTITNTAYFKVKSQYNSFKITSVQVTDQQGNQSNLQAGEMGFIKVNLEANKSITTLVTVNLFDSDLTSIGIGLIKTTLSSGNSEIILSFMIPSDVAVGTSDIYVNAFSDWPSNGGIPLTGEISIAENIK